MGVPIPLGTGLFKLVHDASVKPDDETRQYSELNHERYGESPEFGRRGELEDAASVEEEAGEYVPVRSGCALVSNAPVPCTHA